MSFLPVRGVKGTGIERMHPEYARVTCPFTGDELVVVPPLRPDVALLHAPIGDARGNLHLDQPYVLDARFAAASRMVVATVDRLVSTEEVAAAGVTIPAHTVAAVVEAPFGAHPSSCYPGYAYDRPHLAAYLEAAGERRRHRLPRRLRARGRGRLPRGRRPGAADALVGVGGGLAGAVPVSDASEPSHAGPSTSGSWWRSPARCATGRSCSTASRAPARRSRCTSPAAPTRRTACSWRAPPTPCNPDPVFIPPTSNDLALHQGAVYRMTFEEFFDAACRGDVDRMFLSGGQIDGYGNTNVTAIGPDPTRPKIKLGGGGGGCNISATIGALTVWTTRHRSGRTLVRDLDVLTDIGHRTPEGDRARSWATRAAGRSG